LLTDGGSIRLAGQEPHASGNVFLLTTIYLLPRIMSKLKLKSRMTNLLMFLPNMVALSGRLMVDKRVPVTERALFAAAVIYAIIPFDFLPDMIPFLGQIDDLFLVALTLLRLIGRTDDTVVREHWRGGGDIVALAESAAAIAPALMPKRVSRVLSAKVNPTAEGTGLLVKGSKLEPLLVAEPEKQLSEEDEHKRRRRRIREVKSA
jgi:uncharacterized membrane protein YkvA (DUF1232 family)